MKASIAASRKRSVRSTPRLQSSTSGRGRNGACVCLDVGVDGAMDLGMAGRAFAAWIGCGACILHPADRVRRRGGERGGWGGKAGGGARLQGGGWPEGGVRVPGRGGGGGDGLGDGGAWVWCVGRLRRVHPAAGGSGAPARRGSGGGVVRTQCAVGAQEPFARLRLELRADIHRRLVDMQRDRDLVAAGVGDGVGFVRRDQDRKSVV